MRLLRVAVCLAVIAVTPYALDAIAIRPYRCNIVKKNVQTQSIALLDVPLGPAVSRRVHGFIADLQPCAEACPTDADMYMTLAVTDRILGRPDHAIEMYTEALKIERRPELFFNRGVMRLQVGQRALAIEDFMQACAFADFYLNIIPDLELARQLTHRVNARMGRPDR
jgi:tetratricopeptide (TPR) repeat protein